jgi:hypothetical protein
LSAARSPCAAAAAADVLSSSTRRSCTSASASAASACVLCGWVREQEAESALRQLMQHNALATSAVVQVPHPSQGWGLGIG